MAVAERRVHVRVAVRLAGRDPRLMGMLVVLVMDKGVRVLECLVLMEDTTAMTGAGAGHSRWPGTQ
jgi:hypothetical protein